MKKKRVLYCFFKLIYLKIVKLFFGKHIPLELKRGIIAFVFVFIGSLAYGQGVEFREISLDEALSQATKEKRYVFMDCYTNWCGPCRNMNSKVFPIEKVGSYFNSKFVCVKYDLAQAELKEIGTKYGVRAYPTFLILCPDGTVYHKIVGSRDGDALIESVKRAMKKNCSLSYLESLQAKGKMNKEELLHYAIALQEARDDRRTEILDVLLERLTDKEKVKAKYWVVFENKEFGNKGYQFVVANLGTFQKNVGKDVVDHFMQKNYDKLIKHYMVRLQNNTLKDFTDPLKVVSMMDQELASIEIEKKEIITEQLNLLAAYLSNNTKETVEFMGKLLALNKEGQQMVYFMFDIMKNRKNKELMVEVIRAKDYLISQSTELSTIRLTREIDNLKKLI